MMLREKRFCKTTMDNLNLSAPIEKKYACGNQICFMTNNMAKGIKARSRSTNKCLKDKMEESRLLYT